MLRSKSTTRRTLKTITSGGKTASRLSLEDTIPGDTYYEMVLTAPAGASGTYTVKVKNVYVANDYAMNVLASAEEVVVTVEIAEGTGGSTTGGSTTTTDTIPTESTTVPSTPMVGTTTAAPVTPGNEGNGTIPTP